ncbi:hypothetical protein ACI65C_012720 [Semiaphis heraclei]
MPKVRRSRKPPPDGWELIEPTLEELEQKMREAETESHEGKRKVEALWPIFKIHNQKSRYIYDLFHRRKAISRELYDFCLQEKIADQNLIAKWKKQGYENLCCLRCIQTRDTNFGTSCICRVPKSKLEEDACLNLSTNNPNVSHSPTQNNLNSPNNDGWTHQAEKRNRSSSSEPSSPTQNTNRHKKLFISRNRFDVLSQNETIEVNTITPNPDPDVSSPEANTSQTSQPKLKNHPINFNKQPVQSKNHSKDFFG